jgi:hypothetical protein
MIGQIEPTFLNSDIGKFLLAPRAFEVLVFREDLGFVTAVIIVGELEKDQAEYGRGILTGFKVRIGTQIIRRTPQIVFELFELIFRHTALVEVNDRE